METNLKSAPLWILPENAGVPDVSALGSPASLRRVDQPSPAKRASPGVTTREYRIPNLARACQVLRLFASKNATEPSKMHITRGAGWAG